MGSPKRKLDVYCLSNNQIYIKDCRVKYFKNRSTLSCFGYSISKYKVMYFNLNIAEFHCYPRYIWRFSNLLYGHNMDFLPLSHMRRNTYFAVILWCIFIQISNAKLLKYNYQIKEEKRPMSMVTFQKMENGHKNV